MESSKTGMFIKKQFIMLIKYIAVRYNVLMLIKSSNTTFEEAEKVKNDFLGSD